MTLKDRIIDEALKLFSLKGYASTSTTEIISAAGTSKGGFYNHFRTKEELFTAALSRARKIWRERNLAGLDEIANPLERLQKLLENYRDHYLTDSHTFPGGCIFVTFAVELAGQNPGLAAEVNEGFTRLRRMIQRLLDEGKEAVFIRPGADTARVTEIIFTGLLGACVVYNLDHSRNNLNTAIASLILTLQDIQSGDNVSV